MKLRFRGRTDVGKTREHNEDDYGYGEGANVERYGELLVVCDGMGGHAAGEVASHLGVETIISAYYEDPSDDRPGALRHAFELANSRIHDEGRGTMGTTGVAALLHHDALHIANVGDSRAYLIRGGAIRQISRDHSLVSEQVDAGVITPDQARSLYYRNVITRALGYQPDVAVDLFRWPLQPDDLIVLSSDGLHGLLTDSEIEHIAATATLEEAVDQLVDLANERGGNDNITVIVARIDELEWPTTSEDGSTETSEFVTSTSATAELSLQEQPGGQNGLSEDEAPFEPLSAAPLHSPGRPERRMGLVGLLLSAVLLLALIATIWLLRPSEVLAPPTGTTPAATVLITPSAATGTPAPTRPPASPAPSTPTGAATPRATSTPATAPTATP